MGIKILLRVIPYSKEETLNDTLRVLYDWTIEWPFRISEGCCHCTTYRSQPCREFRPPYHLHFKDNEKLIYGPKVEEPLAPIAPRLSCRH